VHVTLVHWNQPHRCTTSLAAFRASPTVSAVTVVDNGSEPRHLALLRDEVPDLDLVTLGANRGFGPAANVGLQRGLQRSEADYLVVAPHDALPAPDCLERLVGEMEHRPGAGLVCADVGDGHVPVFDPYFGGMTVAADPREGWRPVDYPHGTLLMARRSCLLDIGLFDERYFAYCEEADLGVRARRRGWDVGLVQGAKVLNPTMRSGSAAVDYLMQRNTILLVREHSGRYHATIRFLIALWDLLRGAVGVGPPQFLYVPRARLRALFDVLRGTTGPPPADYFEVLDARGDPRVPD
jgi:N-acetylglucosaminyl-diphospho-decaprenol L-rhamnosyltransferase